MSVNEEVSIIIDWKRQSNFIKQLNQKFHISQMDGANKNYQFALTNVDGTSIEDYVDSNGCLNKSVIQQVDMKLKYSTNNQGESTIATVEDTTHTFVSGYINLKAAFIIQKDTKYILSYNIWNKSFPVSEELILPKDSELITIINGVV